MFSQFFAPPQTTPQWDYGKSKGGKKEAKKGREETREGRRQGKGLVERMDERARGKLLASGVEAELW